MNPFLKNKYFLSFLGMWGLLLIVGALVSEELDPHKLVLYTGILSLTAPLLCWVIQRVEAPRGKVYTVYRMDDPKPLCRVEGEWIYPGDETSPKWYLRKGKIHTFTDKPKDYLYRMEGNLIYRRGEEEPCMLIREDTVYSCPDNIPLYQTVE